MIGNTKIITKFIAIILFAIVLVIGNNIVELLNRSDIVIEDKILTDSNDIESNKEVAEITAKQGNKVMQNTMKGYYFDGENFVFMQRNEEKQCMEQLTVPKKELKNYFNKNKIEIQN